MSQRDKAIQEQRQAEAILAMVERTEHGKRLKAQYGPPAAPCLEVRETEAQAKPGRYPRRRIEFASEADAITHRAHVGCGGWVLGRYLYPGAEWTPSEIMLDCPGAGVLK